MIGRDKSMQPKNTLTFSRTSDDTLLIHISGEWKLVNIIPTADEIQKQVETEPTIRRITFDTNELKGWDSGLLTFLLNVIKQCSESNIITDKDGLPHGVQRLLYLATAVSERKGARRGKKRIPFLEKEIFSL